MLLLSFTPFEKIPSWIPHTESALNESVNAPVAALIPDNHYSNSSKASDQHATANVAMEEHDIVPEKNRAQIGRETTIESVNQEKKLSEFSAKEEDPIVAEIIEEKASITLEAAAFPIHIENEKPDSITSEKLKLTDEEKNGDQKSVETKRKKETRSERDRKHNKFNLYFTVMPTFGYQRIESNTTDNLIVESIKKIPAFSMDRLGVRAELGMEVPVSKELKFLVGYCITNANRRLTIRKE